jgi:hypothetical protein
MISRFLLLFSGLFLVGLLSGPAPNGTLAFLASSVQSTGNQFTAGTVHIGNGLAMGATLSMDNLLAGDNFDAQLDVANGGSLALIYTVTTSITGSAPLATALQLTIRAKTLNPCANLDGTVLYTGALADAKIGDPAHGLQTGDRALGAGLTESLCFTVGMPASAPPSLVDTTLSTTFVFTAEQS